MSGASRGGSSAPWRALADELARWRDTGRTVEFWWRDDDAARPDSALARLCELSARAAVPLALAIVPVGADPALLGILGETVTAIQHGTDHRNRAGAGEKKTEFPAAEAARSAAGRLEAARERLAALAQARFVPVLAPPWNRLPEALVPQLAPAGFCGLSRYGARATAEPAPGVRQVNTHVDLVAWQTGRGFVGEDRALGAAVRHLAAKREGGADAGEPTGWLSHHAVHDEAAWAFLERLFETLRGAPGLRWVGVQELFHTS
jgi:hypothetical protein